MYSTKLVNPKASGFVANTDKTPFNAPGEAYKDPNRDLPTRWKGKQLGIISPKKTAGSSIGYFGALEYKPDEYQDKNSYLTTQPLDKRKLGFGSRNAHARDEFMLHTRTEQYREILKRELVMTNKNMDTLRAAGKVVATSPIKTAKSPIKTFDQTRDFRTARDVYGFDPKQRGTGPYELSSQTVGAGIDTIELKKPTFARVSAVKAFKDSSHTDG